VRRGGKELYGLLTSYSVAPLTFKFHPRAVQRATAATLKCWWPITKINKTGYFGVSLAKPGQPKPYQAQVRRGGRLVYLGSFATAEEAALSVARAPEGQAAARRPAAAQGQGMLPAVPSGAILKEEGTVPPMPPGTFVKEEGAVSPMPPDSFVKVEAVVREEAGYEGRPKRQQAKWVYFGRLSTLPLSTADSR